VFCAVELIRIQLVSLVYPFLKSPLSSYSEPPLKKKGETSYPSPSSFDCSTCRWYSIVLGLSASVGFSDAGLVGEVVLREREERGVVGLVGGDIVCCGGGGCVAWRMQDVGL